MKAVFADTFYWAALTAIDDPAHAIALELSRSLAPDRVVTTDDVPAEYGNQDLVRSILDYYFGRSTSPSDPATVAVGREAIAREWGGNSPWMLLLDLVTHDRRWSKERFQSVPGQPGVGLRAGSPQLANAFFAPGGGWGLAKTSSRRGSKQAQQRRKSPR